MSKSHKPVCVEMTIPSSSEFVSVVRLTLSGIAARLNFSVEDIEDLKIAISEACTNAVQHAYEEGSHNTIDLVFNIYSDKLEMIVKDTGKGFNPKDAVSEKDSSGSVDKFGLGLGLTFIKSLMDEAHIESKLGQGTTISMTKYVPQNA